MPTMSAVESAFCRSSVWKRLNALSRGTLPVAAVGAEVLEIGAGIGRNAQDFLAACPGIERYVVTDFDPRMVEVATRTLRQAPGSATVALEVQQADATALQFADDSFDTVISCLMFHHIVDWKSALAEIARVLRPGGTFVGYDLARTPFTRAIHIADRSPHYLLTPREFVCAASELGFTTTLTKRGGQQLMNFVATLPAG